VRTFFELLDSGVGSLDAAAEGASHGHPQDLDQRDAQNNASRDEDVRLDVVDHRVEATFLPSHRLENFLGLAHADAAAEEALEGVVLGPGAAIKFFLDRQFLLIGGPTPCLLHVLLKLILEFLVVGYGKEQENSSNSHGDEEADEEKDEKDAETALTLPNGTTAAEKPNHHDDAAQNQKSDGENAYIFCQYGCIAGSIKDEADIFDEILVGDGPSAKRHDNQPQNPEKEIEEEDEVFGTREFAHLELWRRDGREKREGETCGRIF